jgi:Pyridine nucleotide-disulphide oxidoreductase
MKILVVGAGLFGSVATQLLREHGHEVTVVDEGLPNTASRAAGCVLAPSWSSSLAPGRWEEAMGILRNLYAVREVRFQTNFKLPFTAFHIDPGQILVEYLQGTYINTTAVGDHWEAHVMAGENRISMAVDAVYIATGAAQFKDSLFWQYKTKVLWGASLKAEALWNPHVRESVTLYAPYKQAVCVKLKNQYWFGDGTALSQKTFSKEMLARIQTLKERATTMTGLDLGKDGSAAEIVWGGRPVVEGHPEGILLRDGERTWIATGGGKNGTLAAALTATRFVEQLRMTLPPQS